MVSGAPINAKYTELRAAFGTSFPTFNDGLSLVSEDTIAQLGSTTSGENITHNHTQSSHKHTVLNGGTSSGSTSYITPKLGPNYRIDGATGSSSLLSVYVG